MRRMLSLAISYTIREKGYGGQSIAEQTVNASTAEQSLIPHWPAEIVRRCHVNRSQLSNEYIALYW